jgi:hypothetical protein
MNFCKNINQCNTELCQKMQTKSSDLMNTRLYFSRRDSFSNPAERTQFSTESNANI